MVYVRLGQKLNLNLIYFSLNFNFAPIGNSRPRDWRSGARLATVALIGSDLTIAALQTLSVLPLTIGT
jgi:hypothetical protein